MRNSVKLVRLSLPRRCSEGEEGKRGEGTGVLCWCCPRWMASMQLFPMTPNCVVLDSMWEQGVVYNMLVFSGGRYVCTAS